MYSPQMARITVRQWPFREQIILILWFGGKDLNDNQLLKKIFYEGEIFIPTAVLDNCSDCRL